jgi:hypothetical protein
MFPDYANDDRFWCHPIGKQATPGSLPTEREAAAAVAAR